MHATCQLKEFRRIAALQLVQIDLSAVLRLCRLLARCIDQLSLLEELVRNADIGYLSDPLTDRTSSRSCCGIFIGYLPDPLTNRLEELLKNRWPIAGVRGAPTECLLVSYLTH